eukprot:gb/GECG01016802.1/.p1 GENE.gb/GECG01016802.1/~~gb/GECG01016802.1/.p1  ORF type:complete len:508 (+),score=51.72 gb/GECG01016802.1/:1-1524(+)
MERTVDQLAYSKTEATLGLIGIAYGILLTVVLWLMSAKFDTESLSHRFRYLVLLLGSIFVRMLCSLIGVGEARYAQNDQNSILPFFLFDVGDLMFVVSIIAKSGAQIRNFLSFEVLVRRGVVARETPRRRESGSEQEVYHSLNEGTDGIQNGDNYSRNFPFSEFTRKVCKLNRSESAATRIDRLGRYVFSWILLISLAYTAMTGVLYHVFENGVKRHKAEQIFLIIVYSVTFIQTVITTYFEQVSGSLNMAESNGAQRENQDGPITSTAEAEVMPNFAFTLSPSEYGSRQLRISTAFAGFLLLRIAYSAYQIIGGIANEFKNEYWLLIIEYGIEMGIMAVVFYWLLSPLEGEGSRAEMIHGSYDSRDPYFVFRIMRKFCRHSPSSVQVSASIHGKRRHLTTHISQILRLMNSTAAPINAHETGERTDEENGQDPSVQEFNEALRQFSQEVQEMKRVVQSEGGQTRETLQASLQQHENKVLQRVDNVKSHVLSNGDEINELSLIVDPQ